MLNMDFHPDDRRYDKLAFAAVIVLLFFLLILGIRHNTFDENDGVNYAFLGKGLLEGSGYDSYLAKRWPPGFPVLIGSFSLLLHDLFISGKAVSIMSAVLVAFLSYKIAALLFGRKAGLIALLFVVTNKLFLFNAFTVNSDMPFMLFILASCYYILKEVSLKNFAIAGILAGISLMIRWNALFNFLPVVAAYVATIRTEVPRQNLKLLAAFLGGFILASSPWLLANYSINGGLLYNENWQALLMSMYIKADTAQGMLQTMQTDVYPKLHNEILPAYNSLADVLSANYPLIIVNWAQGLFRIFQSFFSGGFLFLLGIFAIPGIMHLFSSVNERRSFSLIMIGIWSFLSGISFSLMVHRYLLPMLPFFAAFGAFFILHRLPARVSMNSCRPAFARLVNAVPLRMFAVFLVIFSNLALSYFTIHSYLGEEHRYKEVGTFLMERGAQRDEIILSMMPSYAYYAGTGYATMPLYYADPKDYVTYAMPKIRRYMQVYPASEEISPARPADYFIFDESGVTVVPHLEYLFNPKDTRIPQEFEPIYLNEKKPRVVVYKTNFAKAGGLNK